jgi:nucleotide-binding universal stress UspA family protein
MPGLTVPAICKRSHEVSADRVVMTTHGRTGINRAWVGSIADGVLRKSGVPVLMCRPRVKTSRSTPFTPFRKILVLTDGSITSMGVMKRLHIAGRAKLELAETARDMSEKYAVEIESHVLIAHDVSEAIIDFALRSNVDAIAMSTHGRGASRLVPGSVADKIIHATALPLLLQTPAGTPATAAVVGETRTQSVGVLST